MIRTFFDSGVLIAGAKGIPAERTKALAMLRDPGRQFLTSPFLHLEVVPKAVFNKNRLEERFYEIYFRNAEWSHARVSVGCPGFLRRDWCSRVLV